MNEKLNPFIKYEDTETKHLQVIFLTHVVKTAYETIAELTGYAINTIKNYMRKFENLVDKAKKLFDAVAKTIEKKVDEVKTYFSKYDNHIFWEVVPTDKPCGYVLEFWDNKKLLFLKVGMTNDIRRRVKEHLNNYNKTAVKNKKPYKNLICKVKMIYEAKSEDNAIIIESALREFYKGHYKDVFVRQDRFMEVPYQEEEKNNERFCSFLALAGA